MMIYRTQAKLIFIQETKGDNISAESYLPTGYMVDVEDVKRAIAQYGEDQYCKDRDC